ncbi:hypothetical protein ACXYMO_01255 [Arenibacterium sp. CAU 1754]
MRSFLALCCGLALALPACSGAAPKNDACDAQARQVSGYTGARPVEFNVGPFDARISGSVAVGVSRTRGPAREPVAPPFAGAASVEAREKPVLDAYRRAYNDCLRRQ